MCLGASLLRSGWYGCRAGDYQAKFGFSKWRHHWSFIWVKWSKWNVKHSNGQCVRWFCDMNENTEKLVTESRHRLMNIVRMKVERSVTSLRATVQEWWESDRYIYKRREGQRGITSKHMIVMIRYKAMPCDHSLTKQRLKIQSLHFPMGESAKSPSHMKESSFNLSREW